MRTTMLEILHYSFMLRALIAGLLVALILPVLGGFLVARRYALISDSLAHVSLAGIGAGLLFGISPVYVAIPVTVTGALLLEWLRRSKKLTGDISLAIVMSGGLALAVVLANLAQGANVNFTNYLFGSITTTTTQDVVTLAIVGMLVLIFVGVFYRPLLHISFDEDSAIIAGYKVRLLNYMLVALTAATVVLSLRIVGGLLISAVLVIPIITASRFAKSFAGTILWSVPIALLAVICGLVAAFYLGIAAGGAIVLAALALMGLAMIWQR
jgi:zinc transport system permease protein